MRTASFVPTVVGLGCFCLSTAALALDCPSEAEVQAAIAKWYTDYNMDPIYKDIWKVKAVSDFQFGPVKFGKIVQRQVEYGASAQDVCPVRVDFSFVIENESGGSDPQEHRGETMLFYKNGFDEYVYKTGE